MEIIEIEFGIFELNKKDDCFFTGRIHHGPIKIGDVFTYVYILESNYEMTPDGDKIYTSVNKKNHQKIRLIVESMYAYKIYFDELGAGMTALIKLSGTGKDIIRKLIGDTERIDVAIGNKV